MVESSNSSYSCRVSPREKRLPTPENLLLAFPGSMVLDKPCPVCYFALLDRPSPLECFSDILDIMAISRFKIILCPSVIGVASVNNVQWQDSKCPLIGNSPV